MSKLNHKIRVICVSLVALFGLVLLGLSLPVGGWRSFSVQTGSMEPAIKTDSLVFVHRVPVEQLRPGDVITYINPSNKKETITHRLIAIKTSPMGSEEFITQGDANQLADPPVAKGQIVGSVQGHVPYIGKVTSFLREPIGLALIVYLPALGVIIEEMKRLAAYYRAQRFYRVDRYEPRHIVHRHSLLGAKVATGLVVLTLGVAVPARAALQNQVTLTGNSISSVPSPPPDNNQCTITNSNNVSVTSNTNQSSSTGTATSSNNTTGGTAQSGNASNSSSTSTTVTMSNSANCPQN